MIEVQAPKMVYSDSNEQGYTTILWRIFAKSFHLSSPLHSRRVWFNVEDPLEVFTEGPMTVRYSSSQQAYGRFRSVEKANAYLYEGHIEMLSMIGTIKKVPFG